LLRRFFANLFLNSIQHTDGSGLTVTLDTLPATTQPSQQTSRSAVTGFSLCDDGPGLPDHVRSALSHTRSATTPQHTEPQLESGTGLAVVQQISAHHGWTLSLPNPASTDGAQFNIRSVDFATE
jgi:signal transduction histidine kinase